jgi:hypothetical protein
MLAFLNTIYSVPFITGLLFGLLGERLLEQIRARYEDRHHPYKDGHHHRVGGLSRIWVAGLITALVIGYVIMLAQKTNDDTLRLSRHITRCNAQIYDAIKDRSLINAEDIQLEHDHDNLTDQLDAAQSEWLHRLLNPPADAKTDLGARDKWIASITNDYIEKATDLREKIVLVETREDQIATDRRNHPLPDMDCGNH